MKVFLSCRLSNGQMANREFTSDKPWVPFNANVTIDQSAAPIETMRVEFSDDNNKPIDGAQI